MRPIKLTLSGFESYTNETIIDFTKFGKSELFLISGETGSGKTTIFDAIKFALYGEASGEDRDSNALISKSIADKLNNGDTSDFSKGYRPFVELVFEVNGKKYTVLRKPGYSIQGKTSKQSDAELTSEDGSVTETKVKDVNKKIIELMGLESNQFSSVAMIAQGEFSKLVTADKKDRNQILKDIFGVKKFEKFKWLLKEEKDAAYGKKCESEICIRTHISGIKTNEKNSFSENIKNAIADADSFNLVPVELEKYIEEDKQKYEEKLKEQILINDEIKKNNDNVTLLEQKKGFEKTVNECNFNIENFTNDEKALDKIKRSLDGQKSEIDELGEKKAVIESKLKKYSELSEIENAVKTLTSKTKELKIEINGLDADIKKKDNRSKEIKEELKGFENVSAEKIKAETESENLQIRYDELKKLSDALKETNELCKKLSDLQDKAKDDAEKYRQEQNNLTEKTDLYLKEQAGILAKDLEEGMPCPVCGNTHHIKKAILSENAVTKEEIDKLNKKVETLKKQADNSSKEAGNISGKYNAKKEVFENKFKELLPDKSLDNSAEVIKSEMNTITKQKNALTDKIKKYESQINLQKTLNKDAEEIEKELPDLRDKFDKLSKSEISKTTEKEVKEEQIEKIRKELEFPTEAEAKQEVEKYNNTIKKYNNDVENNTKKLNEITGNIKTETGKLQQAEKSLKELPELDEEKINSEEIRLKKIKNSIDEDIKTLNTFIANNKDCFDSINKEKEKYENLSETYGMLETMYKVANGTRLTPAFETYILSYYFKRIVIMANERLMKITDGQYQLDLPDDGTLELDVIDLYNNTRREAKSLSGGEKFKAALSLAFGFADVMGGGNRLESLFIDEGFGSLSDDSLKSVLRLLIEQSGGNKLIGIISHVNEMKDAINNKILVEKDHSGCSSVKICVSE